MVGEYIPERGDIVWLDFSPQAGHEQAGRRPALVVSPAAYNRASGLALVCPVTTRVKGYPFEVSLPPRREVSGVVLADQIRCVDWRARRVDFIVKILPNEVGEVLLLVAALLGE